MEHLSYQRKITIMAAIITSMFFASINQTIVGVALPSIIARLGGMEYYTWIITIYFLAATVSTILVGKLSDIYGRKYFIFIRNCDFYVRRVPGRDLNRCHSVDYL